SLGQAFASSGPGSGSGSGVSAGSSTGSFSRADSAASLAFIAPTNKPVNKPPLNNVLRKNSHVCGQPPVPLVKAISHPVRFPVYSGLWNGLKNHEAVLVIR